MSTVIKGTPDRVLVEVVSRFVPQVGFATSYTYEYARRDDMVLDYNSVVSSGWQAEMDDKGPPWRLQYSDPSSGTDPEIPIDTWEVPPIKQDKSLLQLPSVLRLTEHDRAFIHDANEAGADADPTEINSDDGTGVFDEAYRLMRAGSDHYESLTYSVRWTRTVSNRWEDVGILYSNVGRIWTTAALLSLSPPKLIANSITAAAATIPAAVVSDAAPSYAAGWLKDQVSVMQKGLNKFEIVQDWTLENWSTFIYGSPI